MAVATTSIATAPTINTYLITSMFFLLFSPDLLSQTSIPGRTLGACCEQPQLGYLPLAPDLARRPEFRSLSRQAEHRHDQKRLDYQRKDEGQHGHHKHFGRDQQAFHWLSPSPITSVRRLHQ